MLICVYCKDEFKPKKNMYAKYCSTVCQHNNYKSNLKEKVCENSKCHKTYKPRDKRQRFCSKSCSATYNNPRTKRKPREFSKCQFCETKLEKYQNKFCSHDCRVLYQSYIKYEDWINGCTDASNISGNLKPWARNILIEMCDYTCKCGWNKVNPVVGKPILTVDHVDGNWTNNYCWNLEVLCYNCHTLTPTFGALNRESISGRRKYKFVRDTRVEFR